jgi:hypothetical protein
MGTQKAFQEGLQDGAECTGMVEIAPNCRWARRASGLQPTGHSLCRLQRAERYAPT